MNEISSNHFVSTYHSGHKISSSQKESQGDVEKSDEWMSGTRNNLATEGNCSNNDSQPLLSAEPCTNWCTSSQQISDAGAHRSVLRLWNKWPQARRLKHTEMYSVVIREPRSLRSRFQSAVLPAGLEALGRILFAAFRFRWLPQSMASMACGHLMLPLPLPSHHLLLCCLYLLLF